MEAFRNHEKKKTFIAFSQNERDYLIPLLSKQLKVCDKNIDKIRNYKRNEGQATFLQKINDEQNNVIFITDLISLLT